MATEGLHNITVSLIVEDTNGGRVASAASEKTASSSQVLLDIQHADSIDGRSAVPTTTWETYKRYDQSLFMYVYDAPLMR